MRVFLWFAVMVSASTAAFATGPTCSSYQQRVAPNSPQCFEAATGLQDTDIIYGVQGTGPTRSNQSVKIPLSQLKAAAQAVIAVRTTDASYAASASDRLICVNHSAPVTITLMPSPSVGALQTVMDCSGAADTQTITVQPASGTVMGTSDVSMTQPYMSLDFVFNGNEWALQ